jgi:hypothetical protein
MKKKLQQQWKRRRKRGKEGGNFFEILAKGELVKRTKITTSMFGLV